MQARLIAAQDQHGDNVNLLLLAIYLERQGTPLLTQWQQHLASVIQPFNKAHTARVRSLRRELTQSDQIAKKSRQQLKEQLLASELTLEKQEQVILIDAYNHLLNTV